MRTSQETKTCPTCNSGDVKLHKEPKGTTFGTSGEYYHCLGCNSINEPHHMNIVVNPQQQSQRKFLKGQTHFMGYSIEVHTEAESNHYPKDPNKLCRHIPYTLTGPRGKEVRLVRNIPNPNLLGVVVVSGRSLHKKHEICGYRSLTDMNGKLEPVGPEAFTKKQK